MSSHPDVRGFRFRLAAVLTLALCGTAPLAMAQSDDWDFDALFADDAAPSENTEAPAATTPSVDEPAEGNASTAPADVTDAGVGLDAEAETDEPAGAASGGETLDTIAVESLSEPAAPPQRDRPRKKLEEIIVVAQKKTEAIQDVPISISVVDEQFIEEWSITDLNTAALYAPNVKIADAGYYILPRIRGFGTDQNNKAFEPPAGVAIDGIPYTRLEYFTSALFDLSRMEVYRGPQGTAFGKNTTAGLIHLITRSPTDEFEGFVDIQYGDYDRRHLEAAVGGPLIMGFLNFRIAGLSDDRTGFVHNSATVSLNGAPEYGRGSSRQGLRLKLDFVDLFGSSLLLSAETVDVHAEGAGIEVYDVTEDIQSLLLRYDPATDFVRGNNVNTINDPDFRKVKLDTYNAEWHHSVSDWGLVGMAGYSVLRDDAALDVDASPGDFIWGSDKDRSPTTTAELRLESPELDGLFGLDSLFGVDLGSSNFLAGLYYQRRQIDGDGIVFRFGTSYLELFLVSELSATGLPPLLTGILNPVFGLVPSVLNLIEVGNAEEVTQDFDQLAEAGAVFGQFDWQMNNEWAIELGLRLNRESKDAHFNQYYSSPAPNILMPLFGIEQYQRELSQSETQLAPRVSLNYEPTDDIGIFLHWTRGFRGGGFNAFSYRDRIDELTYDDESATDWGLDLKSTLLDGRMRFNISLFRLDVDNFQVLTGVENDSLIGIGVGGTKVENAAKARAQGVEADLTWLVYDWFTLFSTFGLNDTEYLKFTNNSCPADNENSDGDDDPRCDVSGKPFPLTPKYSGTMLGMVTLPLNRDGLVIQIGGGFDYQSEQYTTFTLDDRFTQSAVTRWRASIGIGHAFEGWSFRLQGENLTDEKITVRQGQTVKGMSVESLEAPRTIYGTFRYNFGA